MGLCSSAALRQLTITENVLHSNANGGGCAEADPVPVGGGLDGGPAGDAQCFDDDGSAKVGTMRRNPIPYRPVEERMGDWQEVVARLPKEERGDLLNTQSARCMNCGTPFCHQTSSGVRPCPAPAVCLFIRVASSLSVSVSALIGSRSRPAQIVYSVFAWRLQSLLPLVSYVGSVREGITVVDVHAAWWKAMLLDLPKPASRTALDCCWRPTTSTPMH